MTRCLPDPVLVQIHHGESTAADRHHLATCLPCAARHQRLARDLATIDRVLAGSVRRSGRSRKRLAMLVTALAALALLAMGEGWLWKASKSLTGPGPTFDVGTLAFLEDVDAVLSGSGDTSATVLGPGDEGSLPSGGSAAPGPAEP